MIADGEFMIHDPFIKPSGFAGYSRITAADLQVAIDQVVEAREPILDIYCRRWWSPVTAELRTK
jgi:hypothetical protein